MHRAEPLGQRGQQARHEPPSKGDIAPDFAQSIVGLVLLPTARPQTKEARGAIIFVAELAVEEITLLCQRRVRVTDLIVRLVLGGLGGKKCIPLILGEKTLI